MSVSREQNSFSFSICFCLIHPLSANKNCGYPVGSVCNLYTLQVPAWCLASVVMLHFYSQEITQIQHLQQEAVSTVPLKQIPKPLFQWTFPRVSVYTIDGNENIGISPSPLHITCDNNNLIFDGNQAAHFAGETLNALDALECDKLAFLCSKRDLGITVEKVPGEV